MEEVRLQKYLADCGIASRRKCEQYIQQGKVQVNGKVITELGTKINPKKVQVKFENKEIKENRKLAYILLNKPIGYVTTVDPCDGAAWGAFCFSERSQQVWN